jgi:hypothetical protein
MDIGVDTFWLNMSHGMKDHHALRIDLMREIEGERGNNLGLLGHDRKTWPRYVHEQIIQGTQRAQTKRAPCGALSSGSERN